MTNKQLALKEAEQLRIHLTKTEKQRLLKQIDILDPDSYTECIYGLVTGNCESKRANNLILKCCERVYTTNPNIDNFITKAKLNGAPTKIKKGEKRLDYYCSPIERVLLSKNGIEFGKKLIKIITS